MIEDEEEFFLFSSTNKNNNKSYKFHFYTLFVKN